MQETVKKLTFMPKLTKKDKKLAKALLLLNKCSNCGYAS